VDESGGIVDRPNTRTTRFVLQAGQPLLMVRHNQARQLIRLTRGQMRQVLERLRQAADGRAAPVEISSWNQHPVAAHAIAGVLLDMGFRLADGAMHWPARSGEAETPAGASLEAAELLPCPIDPAPVGMEPDHALPLVPKEIRPLVKILLSLLEKEFPGWQIEWGRRDPRGSYRGVQGIWMWPYKRFINLIVHPAGKACRGGRERFHGIRTHVAAEADLNDAFVTELRRVRDAAQIVIDAHLARHPEQAPPGTDERAVLAVPPRSTP